MLSEETKRLMNKEIENIRSNCRDNLEAEIFPDENSIGYGVYRIRIPSSKNKPYCTGAGTYLIRRNGRNEAIYPILMRRIVLERKKEYPRVVSIPESGMRDTLRGERNIFCIGEKETLKRFEHIIIETRGIHPFGVHMAIALNSIKVSGEYLVEDKETLERVCKEAKAQNKMITMDSEQRIFREKNLEEHKTDPLVKVHIPRELTDQNLKASFPLNITTKGALFIFLETVKQAKFRIEAKFTEIKHE